MITQPQAERIAAAINALRPEWPVASLVSFIGKNLQTRAALDAAVALTYVALDRNDKGEWCSVTPGRVLEAGPWWRIGTNDAEADERREKAARDREERLAAIKARNRAIRRCDMCDDQGYIGAIVCDHETEQAATARRGAARARAALAAARKPEEA